MNSKTAKKAALAAIEVLDSRGGFDHFWDMIDQEDKDEILGLMAEAISLAVGQ